MDAKGKLEKSVGKTLVIMLALSFFMVQLAFPYVSPTHDIAITNVSPSKTGDKVQGSHQTIYVKPSSLQVTPCTDFTVNVSIRDVTDLYAWQFNMTFDPNLMQCLSVTEGPFLKSVGSTTFPSPGINNITGEIKAGCLLLGSGPGVNGGGTLATITFHCTGLGGSALHLHDTKLLNSSAVSVSPPPNLGDVNGDGGVDIKDVVIVAKAYCSKPGDPRWNPQADLNNDGVVDIMDLVIVTINFGHLYPPSNALQPVNNVIAHIVEDGYVTQSIGLISHDVAITNVSPSKTVVCLGYNITINVALQNNGNYTDTFTVWTFCGLHQNITLPANTSITIHYTFSTSKLKKGTYRVWAYVPMPDDARPNDNIRVGTTFIVSMVGDLTGPDGWPDGKCDMRDIRAVAKLFGVVYPDPKYNPNCDVNCDGKIDMKDIRTVAKEFGKIDP